MTALKDVTLRVRSGEYVALLGASGSGKTTLLNVTAGLALPTSGHVEVLDQELTVLSEAERARLRLASIGVVFQDHNLIAEFSAIENVMLPLRARGWSQAEAHDAAVELLADFGIEELQHRKPRELSGGQRQRVGIARGLAGGRRVLLADEPTGALDSVTSGSVFELLARVARQGVAVVVATHDPLVRRYASRVVSMRDGSIVGDVAEALRA